MTFPYTLKRQWIEALRSGKYEQGKTQLRRHDAFCCLGVLCDIHPDVTWDEGKSGDYFAHTKNGVSVTGLPHDLKEELGWASDGDPESELISMNDNGDPFPVIARWIEDNIKTEDLS